MRAGLNIFGIMLAAVSVAAFTLFAVFMPRSLSATGTELAGAEPDAIAAAQHLPTPIVQQHLNDRIVVLELPGGKSLADLLEKAGLTAREAYEVSISLSDVLDMTRIQAGQEVEVRFKESVGPDLVSLPVRFNKTVIARQTDDGWSSEEIWTDYREVPVVAHAVVESSLYQAAKDENIPLSVMMEAINLFSFEVDFQRDIQSGERITVLYEQLRNEHNEVIGSGDLLYARLELESSEVNAWLYERLDGEADYYEADGSSVRKALLKTPVDGARISSGFGLRNHPILGYTALHRGVDFAVATGTPVVAAGDGTVTIAGWHDQYGWRVKLHHGNSYDTMYAHFSSIARGIVPGVKVKQGQVVGYVGSTGTSTGPHCHYEVHYYGSPVNPATLKFPPGHSLNDDDLRLFQLDLAALAAEYNLD